MVILTDCSPPSEGIRHKQDHTQAHVKGNFLGSGTLFVAESQVSWIEDGGQGFHLQYPAISLHAVSRDLTNFPHECLYLMVDANLDPQEQTMESDDDSSGEEDSNSNITEVRFIPEDKTALEQMYTAMSNCQVLHPDPEDTFSEDEEDPEYFEPVAGDGGFFQTEEDLAHLNPQGQATLQRLEAMLAAGDSAAPQEAPQPDTPNGDAQNEPDDEMDTGQFEDA